MTPDKRSTIDNCVIESTMLGIEDHGCMIFYVHCSGDGWGQGFGGRILDQPEEPGNYKNERRTASGFGIVAIRAILEAVGVDTWEELRGKNARLDHQHDKALRIGHIVKDQWADLDEIAERFHPKKVLR